MSEKVIVKREVLLDQCIKILLLLACRQDEAAVVADNLVAADQTGMDSHGVMRVPAYTKRLRDGGTLPHSEIEVVRETPTTAVIDGHNGMGQVVSKFAMEKCIEKAKKCGVAFVAGAGQQPLWNGQLFYPHGAGTQHDRHVFHISRRTSAGAHRRRRAYFG